MPKRRHSRTYREDIDRYINIIKKLEQKILQRQNSSSTSESENVEVEASCDDISTQTPSMVSDDWLLSTEPDCQINETNINNTIDIEPLQGSSTSIDGLSNENTSHHKNLETITDPEILQILGDDPACEPNYGPEIRNELASRILHIVKEGLSKEYRKHIISKYLVPLNCAQIEAPTINAEIKAAVTETVIKRDRAIEVKQKQMACAIACVTDIINTQINSQTKNNDMLQKLMDISKILCDIQHADSITRRNFILFTLKSDMKAHVKNTNIDKFLFGENLADTLKSPKPVNKSGVELKAGISKPPNKFKGLPSRPLNYKAPPQACRQPAGSSIIAPRSYESAKPRKFFPQGPPHQMQQAQSLRTSLQPQQATQPRRRRY